MAARAGWYEDPEVAGQRRYWDGAKWTDRRAPAPRKGKWGPDDYLGWGIIVSVLGGLIGGVVYAENPDAGFLVILVVAFIGGLLLSIGIVAKGVEIGMRRSKS